MGNCTCCQDGTAATTRLVLQAPEFDEPMEMRMCERHANPVRMLLLALSGDPGVLRALRELNEGSKS